MLLEVTEHNLAGVTASVGLVVIDFWSPWCSPCNMLNPVIKKLAENNTDITIGKLNTVENTGVAGRYGIDAIPTILFFKNGKMVKKILGYHNEAVLQRYINELK